MYIVCFELFQGKTNVLFGSKLVMRKHHDAPLADGSARHQDPPLPALPQAQIRDPENPEEQIPSSRINKAADIEGLPMGLTRLNPTPFRVDRGTVRAATRLAVEALARVLAQWADWPKDLHPPLPPLPRTVAAAGEFVEDDQCWRNGKPPKLASYMTRSESSKALFIIFNDTPLDFFVNFEILFHWTNLLSICFENQKGGLIEDDQCWDGRPPKLYD